MSKAAASAVEETFTSKLDIVSITPDRLAKLVEVTATDPRTILCAVGMPGIGKTRTPIDVAAARKVPYYLMEVPRQNPEDFSVPGTPVDGNKSYYDSRIPRRYDAILSFAKANPDKHPIIICDELNRARDNAIINAIFTMFENRMVGDTRIPDNVQFVATMNPAGGSMMVNQFEKDPAFRRRLLFVGITASLTEFLRYSKKKNWHHKVIEHLEAQPTWLNDTKAQSADKIYACPASWETISNLCYSLQLSDCSLTGSEARALFAGKIGLTAATAFIDFIENQTVIITAKDVMNNYKPDSELRKRVRKSVEEGQPLTNVIAGLVAYIFDNKNPKMFADQLGLFMSDVLPETNQAFIHSLHSEAKAIETGSKMLSRLITVMAGKQAWETALQTLADIRAMAETEKAKS